MSEELETVIGIVFVAIIVAAFVATVVLSH